MSLALLLGLRRWSLGAEEVSERCPVDSPRSLNVCHSTSLTSKMFFKAVETDRKIRNDLYTLQGQDISFFWSKISNLRVSSLQLIQTPTWYGSNLGTPIIRWLILEIDYISPSDPSVVPPGIEFWPKLHAARAGWCWWRSAWPHGGVHPSQERTLRLAIRTDRDWRIEASREFHQEVLGN